MSKNCPACVYGEVCEDRVNDPSIVDCFIAEAPLRRKQAEACDAQEYGLVTNVYIMNCKANSVYWTSIAK